MSSTIASTQQAEVEETIKRIQTHKGVHGFIIVSNDGNFIFKILLFC
jgi:predicted regulator of Ras-like GTPase activity (Roadblock/LC7/MglB family)